MGNKRNKQKNKSKLQIRRLGKKKCSLQHRSDKGLLIKKIIERSKDLPEGSNECTSVIALQPVDFNKPQNEDYAKNIYLGNREQEIDINRSKELLGGTNECTSMITLQPVDFNKPQSEDYGGDIDLGNREPEIDISRSKELLGETNECTSMIKLQPVDFNKPQSEEYAEDNNINLGIQEQEINISKHSLTIDYEKEDEYNFVSGRRLIDINYFMSQLQEKAHHNDLFNCEVGYFKLVGEKRIGLISKFKFECNVCRKVIVIDSENCNSSAKDVNVNIAATSGIIAAGIGFSQFEEIFSAMNVPVFSSKYYSQLQEIVYTNWEKAATQSMAAAAEREKLAAIAEGRVKNGIPLIDVYVDGAWGLRSYGNNHKSNSGTAAIIGRRFGEVIYIGVKNKYCSVCARAENQMLPAKAHTCFKNYSGPSGAMEADIICEGFKSSIEMYGLIYARMIGDGDSSTYHKILQAKPYPHHTVEKIECRNHILRNFCNKLRAIAKDTKYNVKHRKTLTNEKIMSMRKLIVKSIKFLKNSDDKNVSINLLHKDITNSVAHAYGDHRFCYDYNCSKERDLRSSSFKDIQNSTFLFRINAIVATVANKSRSLIEDVDTNVVERFNSVIAKFVGGKRINLSQRRSYQARCSAAVVSFNDESSISTLQKAIFGQSPNGKIKELEKRRSLKRTYNKKHPTKKKRKFERNSHNYGPKSSAPDLNSEELEKAKEDFITNLKSITSNRENIERKTILQRDSSEWMELRKNLVTASNFGTICKRKITTNTANTVKNLLYKKNISHVTAIVHGVENEKLALQQMEQQENIKIDPCGLFIDPQYPFIGATPDGLVGKDTIVEVKCPISALKSGIDAAIKENKIQLYKYDKKKQSRVINKNSNWYFQIQGQLHVTGREKCIVGLWSGQNQPLIIEYIYKDDQFWSSKMEQKIVDFYLNHMLPEIVDPRQIRGMPLRDITFSQNNVR